MGELLLDCCGRWAWHCRGHRSSSGLPGSHHCYSGRCRCGDVDPLEALEQVRILPQVEEALGGSHRSSSDSRQGGRSSVGEDRR